MFASTHKEKTKIKECLVANNRYCVSCFFELELDDRFKKLGKMLIDNMKFRYLDSRCIHGIRWAVYPGKRNTNMIRVKCGALIWHINDILIDTYDRYPKWVDGRCALDKILFNSTDNLESWARKNKKLWGNEYGGSALTKAAAYGLEENEVDFTGIPAEHIETDFDGKIKKINISIFDIGTYLIQVGVRIKAANYVFNFNKDKRVIYENKK